MPLPPGTRIGPHEVLAPLGAGGMGERIRESLGDAEAETAIAAVSATPLAAALSEADGLMREPE